MMRLSFRSGRPASPPPKSDMSMATWWLSVKPNCSACTLKPRSKSLRGKVLRIRHDLPRVFHAELQHLIRGKRQRHEGLQVVVGGGAGECALVDLAPLLVVEVGKDHAALRTEKCLVRAGRHQWRPRRPAGPGTGAPATSPSTWAAS